MNQVTHAFDVTLGYLLAFGAFCMGYVYQAETFLRARMTEMNWSPGVQTLVLVGLAVLLVLVLLRVLGPLLRVALVLFLLVLALQFLHPETWRVHADSHADFGAVPCVSTT